MVDKDKVNPRFVSSDVRVKILKSRSGYDLGGTGPGKVSHSSLVQSYSLHR